LILRAVFVFLDTKIPNSQ